MRDVIEQVLAAESEARALLERAEDETNELRRQARRAAREEAEGIIAAARQRADELESEADRAAEQKLRSAIEQGHREVEAELTPDAAAHERAVTLVLATMGS